MRDIRRNDLPKFTEHCMETPRWCHPAGIQQKRLSPGLSLIFCYEILNSSLEELINIKVILFFNTVTVKIEKFPQISHFLT